MLALSLAGALSATHSIDATLALHRRGLAMLHAKRAVERAMGGESVVVVLPLVEDVEAVRMELAGAGFAAVRIAERPAPDVRALRERLGLTREQFALRYGLSVENLRNWEDGRRALDSTARSYLAAISADPNGIPLPYEVLTP